MILRSTIRVAALAAAVTALSSPLLAQGLTTADPTVIRRCLCLERNYQALDESVRRARALHDDAQTRSASIGRELESERGSVSPNDAIAVETFRQRSAEKVKLDESIRLTLAPALEQAVRRYNDSVAAYNQSCQGLSYDARVLASVRATLACPAQQP